MNFQVDSREPNSELIALAKMISEVSQGGENIDQRPDRLREIINSTERAIENVERYLKDKGNDPPVNQMDSSTKLDITRSDIRSSDQSQPIYVTKPSMPPLEEFIPYLKSIWESARLTNNGPFHQQLEQRLCEHLGVEHISLFSNGTLALITALQALRITGEVITTPYSFVATTHALHWNRIKPVFIDIEPRTFNLNPGKIEAAITPETTAILPVHVYGNPCEMDKIKEIADRYGLKVVYDAAHAFGVKHNGESILRFGDLSVLSFHATKVFNTFEGGAIVSHDSETKSRIDYLKNFGFADEATVVAPGINAKLNEVQAAFGLLQLNHLDRAIEGRKKVTMHYRRLLENASGISLMEEPLGVEQNYSYFPILIDQDTAGVSRDDIYQALREQNIFARRYFWPLISQFPTYSELPSAKRGSMPVAENVAERILCLPVSSELADSEIERTVQIIKSIRRTT
jgi:dTDP-4-amino-4,6-dideoxygalactose transaminase